MKNYLGKINDQKGNQFTKCLKDLYESPKDDNLHIWAEVLIQPNKTLSANKNYGDIDLLIINGKLKKIVCIEAKDYFEARTAYDLLDQDREIVKALPKVENRDKWCKENKSLFGNYSSKVDGSYSVKTWYVTYNEPAYRYVTHINTSPICMLSSFEIVKNPYIIFE